MEDGLVKYCITKYNIQVSVKISTLLNHRKICCYDISNLNKSLGKPVVFRLIEVSLVHLNSYTQLRLDNKNSKILIQLYLLHMHTSTLYSNYFKNIKFKIKSFFRLNFLFKKVQM